MIDLQELEFRVLAELEEAGQGDIPTTLNVVYLGSPSNFGLDPYLEALKNLTQRDQIRMSVARDQDGHLVLLSLEASLRQIDAKSADLNFNASEGLWIDASRSGPPFGPNYPYIVLTMAGRIKSRELLTARGYQWWSPVN